ncbi:Symplekin [Lamellibrachia satsuma]|nr:Symplekin [Lamellibrachia satsuma]
MDTESRRCTASQFFMEEEQSATESLSTYDRVVELLNQASLLQKDTQRVNNLKLVQELIVHKEPNLLDNFLDEMLAFQSDRSTDVKKTLINFIEDACKTEPDILAKVIGNLCLMLKSDAVPVVKKVILSMATLYKVSLQWVCKAKKMTESIEQTWDYVNQIKTDITEMIDSDNEGFRTHSIKFVEAVIIALSRKTAESIIPVSAQTHISLDQIPETHFMLKLKRLEEEGESALETVLSFMGSLHISSVNLMTCMGTVTTIARQRPQFMARVVQSFETLHVNLPPTLSKSQVASVRKNMKLHMLSLLRHPAAVDFHAQITTLLTDLGATQSEVMKAMPKEEMSRKRKAEEKLQATKKAKVQQPDVAPSHEEEDDYGMTPYVGLGVPAPKPTESLKQTAIDISAEDLITRLTAQNVADLVLLSMVMLPDTMPAQFQATYTPIAAAGTQAQIKHLSRLLATQLTAASLGKGYAEIQQKLKQGSWTWCSGRRSLLFSSSLVADMRTPNAPRLQRGLKSWTPTTAL